MSKDTDGFSALDDEPSQFTSTSPQSIIETLPFLLREDRAPSSTTTFEIRLTGEGGGVWAVHIDADGCRIEQGFAQRADVRYTADAKIWCGMAPRGGFDPVGLEELIAKTREFKERAPGRVEIHHGETGFFARVYDEEKGLPDEGLAPGTRWEDVPINWTCPECGARKEDFERVEI